MKISISRHNTFGFQTHYIEKSGLFKLLAAADWNYSPSEFGLCNGVGSCRYRCRGDRTHRLAQNFVDGNDLIILDVDGGWEVERAVTFLENVNINGIIATTKSHLKEKNGAIAERFRLIMETREPFRGSADEFRVMMKNIIKWAMGKADPVAKDCTRFFYTNPETIITEVIGDKLDLIQFPRKERHRKVVQNSDGDYEGIKQWFIREAIEGQRNATLFKARAFAIDNNIDPVRFVQEINSFASQPLDEQELKNLLRIN